MNATKTKVSNLLFRSKKPEFCDVDGEYVIPLRLSEELAHHLMSGWWPVGFGWASLRERDDSTFDLFIRQANISEDMNLVKLDLVQTALLAALDLANTVTEDESLVSDETSHAAREVRRLVSQVGG